MRRASLVSVLTWVTLLTVASTGHAALTEDREEKALRLRQAVRTSGMEPGADFERKVAALTDAQLEQLVVEHETMGYDENPMTVIIGGLILLILFVLVIVSAVD